MVQRCEEHELLALGFLGDCLFILRQLRFFVLGFTWRYSSIPQTGKFLLRICKRKEMDGNCLTATNYGAYELAEGVAFLTEEMALGHPDQRRNWDL